MTTKKPVKPRTLKAVPPVDDTHSAGGDTRSPRKRTAKPQAKKVVDERTAEQRDADCYGLWVQGWTLVEIAERYEWKAHTTAGDAIQRHIARTPAPEVEGIRRSSIDILLKTRRKLWEQIEGIGGILDLAKLTNSLVQVERRLSELVGADAPRRAEVTGKDGRPLIPSNEDEQVMILKAIQKEAERRLKAVK